MDDKTGSAPMEQDDINELHKMRLEWFMKKGLSQAQMMAFLMVEFVGTFARTGYSEEFAKRTFERMFDSFKKIREELSDA